MTRRSSVRAQARVNYCELAGEASGRYSDAASLQKKAGAGEKKETKLTKRVRALYEDSAVPVHEIARIAGVTERTLYKYVARHGWNKRYRVLPRGEAAARANRGRHMQPSPELAPELSPVKGAGGRFIRREDKDSPVATGLKATDPAGAKRAAAGCGGAAHVAALAQAEADETQRSQRLDRAMETTCFVLKSLREHRAERARKGLPADGDRIELMLMDLAEKSMRQWTPLLPAEKVRA